MIEKTPGVYVNEINTFPPSVAGVNTAVPAFIGYTELHNTNVSSETNGTVSVTLPTRVESLLEYERLFGGSYAGVEVTVNETAAGPMEVVQATVLDTKFRMHYALQLYFLNGGGPCFIVSVGSYQSSVLKANLTKGIEMLEKADDPTLLLFPDLESISGNLRVKYYYDVCNAALDHCATMGDRFAILDVFANVAAGADPIEEFRNKTLGELSYGAAYWPQLHANISPTSANPYIELAQPNANTSGAVGGIPFNGKTLQFVLDDLASTSPTQAFVDLAIPAFIAAVRAAAQAAIAAAPTLTMAPSPAIAGVYVATDASRGVWKAPAGSSLRAISGVTEKFSPADLDDLNVPNDGNGKAVNAIRPMAGRGILVYGARTLDGNSNEWRYVPVRRLFNYVEESISKSLNAFVFQQNDANTWSQVKGSISNFLSDLWRQGGLQGASAEEAFFVQVGLGQTMTAQDVLDGKMIVQIGMAATKPAEFITLNFTHKIS